MSEEQNDANEPIEVLRMPVELDFDFSAGQSASRFLRAMREGKLLGQRCPVDGRVYIPTRGSCPQHGVPIDGDPVELPDVGTIVTYSIVRVPSGNIPLELPYVAIQVLLDGADTVMMHVLGDCVPEDAHMGMRVKAKWKPQDEWETSVGNILYFVPSGEADAAYDTYKEHI